MNETVIILGTAPTLAATPWDNPDVDYWACAPVITHPPAKGRRIDVLFEMHNTDYWLRPEITKRLNDFASQYPDTKIYMQSQNLQIKNSVKYPIEEVQSFVNHPMIREYLTSTIAYMVALAVMSGYKRIELFGVHMASNEEEYSMQRSCVETWLAFGWGRGVDFWLPEESDIMKSTYLYGYQQEQGLLLRAIKEKQGLEHAERDLFNKLEKMKQDYYMQKGAALGMEKFVNDLKKAGMQ